MGDAGAACHGYQHGGQSDNFGMGYQEEEEYCCLFKICNYRFDGSAGIHAANRALEWSTYPVISLTQTENRGLLNEVIPAIDRVLENIKNSHRHASHTMSLSCV